MENYNESLIKQKQNLLTTEIIEKNYDKEKFVDFCLSKKENGDDLNNWTPEELVEIIKQFKDSTSILRDEASLPVTSLVSKEIVIDVDKLQICQSMTDEKSLSTEIKCKKLEKSMLNYTTIKVSVINPKTVDGGFLGSNYILYEVRTDKMDWSVRRRYSHFEQLRNILVKSFPGHLVPPLPSKKVGSRRFEDSFVGKRMKFLEKFLVSVCENEIYKTSEALIAFLSFNDRQMFENKMKELNNILPPLYIEDIKTFEGKVKVIDQDDNEKYFSNISRYFVLQNQVLDRLNGNLKNYHMNIKSACGNLVEIQKDFDTLVTLNSRVMMKEEITKCLGELKDFFLNWKMITLDQNEIIKHNIKDFFKFIKMENSSYCELIKKREECRSKYNSELFKLNVKKEKLWSQMDYSKWKMNETEEKIDRQLLSKDKILSFKKMCYKETAQLNNLHNHLGYLNTMNLIELRRLILSHCGKYMKNIKDFTESFYPTLTQGINVWGNLATFAG